MILALTGHRSERLPDERVVRQRVREVFESTPGIRVVINGLANGFDLWGADEAINHGLEVWSARPWAGHRPRIDDEDLYDRVIQNSAKVVNVGKMEFFPGAWIYQRRNEWMIDHCDRVLAWHDGGHGGTYNAIEYARGKKPVRNIYAP